MNNPQSGAAATDRRCLMMPTGSTMVETSTNVPNNPDRRGANGQPCATRAATAPLFDKSRGLELDADLIPTTGEDVVLRRSAVTTEIETFAPAPVARLIRAA